MTANQNSRSPGLKTTPNKNLSAAEVSVPSHTPGDPAQNRSARTLRSLLSVPDLCDLRNPRSIIIISLSRGASPIFFKFTLHNPLIYRVLTLSNLNKKISHDRRCAPEPCSQRAKSMPSRNSCKLTELVPPSGFRISPSLRPVYIFRLQLLDLAFLA